MNRSLAIVRLHLHLHLLSLLQLVAAYMHFVTANVRSLMVVFRYEPI